MENLQLHDTDPQPSTSQMPSTADLPRSKQLRRVSLPSSPRTHIPAWSFRDDTGIQNSAHDSDTHISAPIPRLATPRKDILDDNDRPAKKTTRKKWSIEETDMLVQGCKKHGVGNWKLMVEDPELEFDNRSPVDLKDRFRTYFNDSYRQLYPNAKTHLSTSTQRGVKADGSSIFDKMRSRKRKPFTPEEDAALRAGYEEHGTSWATIVKNPIFQQQHRRSTDLRDRFRNAFPDLYLSAGYKPRPSTTPRNGSLPKPAKRRKGSDGDLPPPTKLRRGRAATVAAFPDDVKALSDDELSSGDEDCPPQVSTPSCIEATSPPPTPLELDAQGSRQRSPVRSYASRSLAPSPALGMPHDSSYIAPTYRTLNMMPKSGWGLQDWLSSNSRMEPSSHMSALSHSVSSGPPSSLSPSQSFSVSYSHSFSQAVFDRYDLSSAGHMSPAFEFAQSEAGGYGADDNSFSDADMFASSSFRGFTHHSNTAGDLIFGTRSQGGYGGYGVQSNVGHNGIGTVNPMQLHAIDERVESIRLDDHPLPHAVSRLSSSDSQTQSLSSLDTSPVMTQFGLELTGSPIQEMEASLHPPPNKLSSVTTHGAPDDHEVALTPTIPTHPHSGNNNASIAPSAYRRFTHSLPRPHSLLNSSSLPDPHPLGRSASQPDVHASAALLPPPFAPSPPDGGFNSILPSNLMGGLGGDDIPFLDMHYFGTHSTSAELFNHPGSPDHSTGALDLAQSPVQRGHTRSPQLNRTPFFKPPSKPSLAPISISQTLNRSNNIVATTLPDPPPMSKLPRPKTQHHRVQSAVSPADLQLSRTENNKRKRVSWDGGT